MAGGIYAAYRAGGAQLPGEEGPEACLGADVRRGEAADLHAPPLARTARPIA